MIAITLALICGTLYGLLIGVIPAAGADTGLAGLFGMVSFFALHPYAGVVFLMAVVAASTTGDSYAGVLMGIPGANSAAATMLDGYPLAMQGRANYALSAAITTSTLNGLFWGSLVFFLLPYYSQLILIIGIPELWGFVMLSLATVGFITTESWVKSVCAIGLGLVLGLVGMNPMTGVDRLTLGWDYLADGIQIMPLVAGLFAVPELLDRAARNTGPIPNLPRGQTKEGMLAVWQHRWTALRGGLIGAFIGLLPGLGGAVSDWLSYSATVAMNPNEKFGNGNIKGVIGPEGSNNAQKATSMIPTVLFGIPGASFAAVLMGLFAFLGFDMGSLALVADTAFFASMTFGFLGATVLVAIICLLFNHQISKLLLIPFKYYFPVIMGLIIWSCMLYTGGIADLVMLVVFSILGVAMKRWKFSRPALVMAYILAPRVESLSIQLTTIYTFDMLLGRPFFLIICVLIIGVFIWSLLNKSRINYA
jgi:putative tricarboxylic transport membrane protein